MTEEMPGTVDREEMPDTFPSHPRRCLTLGHALAEHGHRERKNPFILEWNGRWGANEGCVNLASSAVRSSVAMRRGFGRRTDLVLLASVSECGAAEVVLLAGVLDPLRRRPMRPLRAYALGARSFASSCGHPSRT